MPKFWVDISRCSYYEGPDNVSLLYMANALLGLPNLLWFTQRSCLACSVQGSAALHLVKSVMASLLPLLTLNPKLLYSRRSGSRFGFKVCSGQCWRPVICHPMQSSRLMHIFWVDNPKALASVSYFDLKTLANETLACFVFGPHGRETCMFLFWI